MALAGAKLPKKTHIRHASREEVLRGEPTGESQGKRRNKKREGGGDPVLP